MISTCETTKKEEKKLTSEINKRRGIHKTVHNKETGSYVHKRKRELWEIETVSVGHNNTFSQIQL